LSANVLATPVITMAIPAGFLAVVTGWGWAATVAAWLLDAGTWIVAGHGAWEPYWRMPDPPLWLSAALAASTAALGVAIVARKWRAAAFGLALGLLAVVVMHPFEPRVGKGYLELAAIDVGQAESLHIALPNGRSMLVDTGGFAGPAGQQRTRLDPGEDVVSPYLWQRGVKRLEVVAISHFHSDHCGGLKAVMLNFRPRELWVGWIPDAMRADVEGWAKETGTRIRQWKRGERAAVGGVEFEALTGMDNRHEGAARNNDSLVLRARYGRHGFLLTGDIEKSVERELVEGGAELRADVLKVAHHGSSRSNLSEFLDEARPAVALISAAGSDWMRLPSEEVVAALGERRVLVLRTDRDGLIWVRSDGRWLEPGAMRWMAAGWARLDPF
jgi:competence protein ComEC